jgi:hypothetical protein
VAGPGGTIAPAGVAAQEAVALAKYVTVDPWQTISLPGKIRKTGRTFMVKMLVPLHPVSGLLYTHFIWYVPDTLKVMFTLATFLSLSLKEYVPAAAVVVQV